MKKDSSLVVSIVVPLSNDGALLGGFLREAAKVLEVHYAFYEILLVDDGSTDDTQRLLGPLLFEIPRIRFLQLSRSFGREVAISAGLETAIGDFVVVLNLATDPVEMVPELVERCRTGTGALCGISAKPRHTGALASAASRLFHGYCRRFLQFDYKENSTDFCILSRQFVNAVTRIKDRHRYLRIFTVTMGYNHDFFTYNPLERGGPQRQPPLLEHFNEALEIAIANSRHPLRLISRLGLLMSGMNFLYVFYIVGVYLFKRQVAEGWTTASLQHTTMFFFTFLILAVLCEYVGRILEETQSRPLYFVAAEKTSSVLLETSVAKNIINAPINLER